MKKSMCMLLVGLMMSTVSVLGNEPTKETSSSENTTAATSVVTSKENKLSEKDISFLTNRLKEIRKMDRSSLTSDEKLQLRKEVLGIKEKLKGQAGVGIYLSGTAILIIILLIILL